jgi:hypothetical protein
MKIVAAIILLLLLIGLGIIIYLIYPMVLYSLLTYLFLGLLINFCITTLYK